MTLNYISCVSACLGRSPGALTCAKLERFVQGVRLGPVAESASNGN